MALQVCIRRGSRRYQLSVDATTRYQSAVGVSGSWLPIRPSTRRCKPAFGDAVGSASWLYRYSWRGNFAVSVATLRSRYRKSTVGASIDSRIYQHWQSSLPLGTSRRSALHQVGSQVGLSKVGPRIIPHCWLCIRRCSSAVSEAVGSASRRNSRC